MKWLAPPEPAAPIAERVTDLTDPYASPVDGPIIRGLHMAFMAGWLQTHPGRWGIIADASSEHVSGVKVEQYGLVAQVRTSPQTKIARLYAQWPTHGAPTVDEALAASPPERAFFPPDLPILDWSDGGFGWSQQELDQACVDAWILSDKELQNS